MQRISRQDDPSLATHLQALEDHEEPFLVPQTHQLLSDRRHRPQTREIALNRRHGGLQFAHLQWRPRKGKRGGATRRCKLRGRGPSITGVQAGKRRTWGRARRVLVSLDVDGSSGVQAGLRSPADGEEGG